MEPQEEVDENPVSPVDLSIFKESLEQNLITILDLLPNQEKSLIIEESCITKFGFFIKTDFLTQRQFTKKIFLLQNSPPDTQSPVLLYIIPPKKECLEMIEKHIKDNFLTGVLSTPSRIPVSRHLLQNQVTLSLLEIGPRKGAILNKEVSL